MLCRQSSAKKYNHLPYSRGVYQLIEHQRQYSANWWLGAHTVFSSLTEARITLWWSAWNAHNMSCINDLISSSICRNFFSGFLEVWAIWALSSVLLIYNWRIVNYRSAMRRTVVWICSLWIWPRVCMNGTVIWPTEWERRTSSAHWTSSWRITSATLFQASATSCSRSCWPWRRRWRSTRTSDPMTRPARPRPWCSQWPTSVLFIALFCWIMLIIYGKDGQAELVWMAEFEYEDDVPVKGLPISGWMWSNFIVVHNTVTTVPKRQSLRDDWSVSLILFF